MLRSNLDSCGSALLQTGGMRKSQETIDDSPYFFRPDLEPGQSNQLNRSNYIPVGICIQKVIHFGFVVDLYFYNPPLPIRIFVN